MPLGFGDGGMSDDDEGEGRRWNNQWVGKEGKTDGLGSTLTHMVSILPEGKPLWGPPPFPDLALLMLIWCSRKIFSRHLLPLYLPIFIIKII